MCIPAWYWGHVMVWSYEVGFCRTESFVQWSPLGTYLVTLHKPGVAFCGGACTLEPLMHYKHPMVCFSSSDCYMVTSFFLFCLSLVDWTIEGKISWCLSGWELLGNLPQPETKQLARCKCECIFCLYLFFHMDGKYLMYVSPLYSKLR